jgi:hypothetical protein
MSDSSGDGPGMLTDSELLRRQQLSTKFRLLPPADWRVLVRTRANVLVTGPENALTAFAQAARPELGEPIGSVACCAPLFPEGHTLILEDVHALDDIGQQRLMLWMDEPRNADMQIIALSSVPLFSMVMTNRFDADLFYRLNTIHLEIQES